MPTVGIYATYFWVTNSQNAEGLLFGRQHGFFWQHGSQIHVFMLPFRRQHVGNMDQASTAFMRSSLEELRKISLSFRASSVVSHPLYGTPFVPGTVL